MGIPGALFSIDPGERAAQLGDEVVAARLVAVPPAAGDALGARDEHELGFANAPWRGEQPRRPRPGLHEIVRVPIARLDPPPGIFRPTVRKRRHAIDGIAAKARLQPLDELRPLLRLGGAVAEKAAAGHAERREIASIERDDLY